MRTQLFHTPKVPLFFPPGIGTRKEINEVIPGVWLVRVAGKDLPVVFATWLK